MTPSETKEGPVNLAQAVVDITGPWGRWQLKFFILFQLFCIIYGWHALQLPFHAPNIDFWCADGGDSALLVNQTVDKCVFGEERTKCTKWNYDVGRNGSFYHSTIISEWDLVCSRQWMASFSQSAYMSGFFVSGLLMTHYSDRFGRKPIMIIGWMISLVATLSAAFSVSIIQFLVSRFLIAFGMSTMYSTGYVMLLEIVGPQYRELIGIAVDFGWSAGYITLPGIAWITRDFRHLLYICAASQLCLALFYSTIYESPRWLLANGKFPEAIAVLKNAVNVNQKNTTNVEEKIASIQNDANLIESSEEKGTDQSKYNILDLFHGWKMGRMTAMIGYIWFANSLVYYGLTLNTNNLAGNPFINFLLMGLIEIPAFVACIYFVKRYDNKRVFLVMSIGAGLSCWASISIEYNYYLGIVFALVGKFCIVSSYTLVVVYTIQMYPTVVRTIAFGSGSVVARFGAIMAPYINELTHQTSFAFTMAVVGIISFTASLMMVPLPGSTGTDMPDKPEDVEKQQNAKLTKTDDAVN